MLADPHSKQMPTDKNNYTEDDFHAALALLTDDNENNNRKRKQPEYWSDSDNDDWPREDYKNKCPYDPTAEIPAEKRTVINLHQTTKETNKQLTTTNLPSIQNKPSIHNNQWSTIHSHHFRQAITCRPSQCSSRNNPHTNITLIYLLLPISRK